MAKFSLGDGIHFGSVEDGPASFAVDHLFLGKRRLEDVRKRSGASVMKNIGVPF
ncbi:MAG: hypothetical protein HY695_07060 [Deltaproteobacteria bacterium]|nr:hypothetical protein [Deltaproteobacteria bacterium]